MTTVADDASSGGTTSGDWVRYLQQLLGFTGYWTGDITGEFTPDLNQAIVRFQDDHGLQPDGAARGPTWAALVREAERPPYFEVDWQNEYPEIYALFTSEDLSDYLQHVVGVDLSVFEGE